MEHMMEHTDSENRRIFEEYTEDIRQKSGAAGIAVAVIDATGNTRYEKFFGLRDTENRLPVDKDTIFGVASVTKSFVALSVMQLCERGLLDLDAPLSRYIPEFTNRNQDTVRIRHLLCHSAGFYPLPRTELLAVAERLGIPAGMDSGDLAYNETLALEATRLVASQMDAQTRECGLIGKPGDYFSYCNDGFGLLSEIVRRIGGEPYFADYVKENILKPLGMTRSGCDFLRPGRDKNAAVLYEKTDGKTVSCRDYYKGAFSLGGAGSMKSTLSDLKRYVAMYLREGKAEDGTEILSASGIRTMCRPKIEYRPDSWYGFGLSVKQLDDITVVEHGGSLTGVSSNISWSYDGEAGVVVLCNTTGVPVSVIADAAMRMYRGRTPVGVRDKYRETVWPKETKKAACGVYGSGEGDQVAICLEADGTLTAASEGETRRLIPVQGSLGILRGYAKDDTVKLFRDDKGEVFAVGFSGRMLPKKQTE